MAKIVGITVLLTVLIALAHGEGEPGDLSGTCDSNGEIACSVAGKEVLRFVMVGMTGTGKSATGNSIVGLALKARDMAYVVWNKLKPFFSRSSSDSVTVKGKRIDFTLDGREVAIVDTPGFFDTRFSVDTTVREILKCTYLIAPGPHAIILVVKADRQTDEVLEALNLMKKVFGKELVKHLIVVFTYGDNLKRDGETIDEFVGRLKGPYKDLLQEADNRYLLFDNTLDPTSEDNEEQVRQLIEMADKIVDRNHGQCYRNDLLEESYQLMKEEEEKQARKIDEERKKREELERQARENELFKAELEKKTAEIEKLIQEKKDIEARAEKVAQSLAAAQQSIVVKRRGGCFASTSSVFVQDSNRQVTSKSLEDLEIGDLVESYDPDTKSVVFSPVYYIIYKDDNETISELRRLYYADVDGGVRYLTLQPKHMVYANMLTSSSMANSIDIPPLIPPLTPSMSEDIKIGDILWIKNASGQLRPKPVIKTEKVSSHVRHPLTFSHYIIVDGVLASVHMHNEWLSRGATTPLRVLYNISPSLTDVWLTKKMVNSWDWVEKYLLE